VSIALHVPHGVLDVYRIIWVATTERFGQVIVAYTSAAVPHELLKFFRKDVVLDGAGVAT
jgi:hypothetical protein